VARSRQLSTRLEGTKGGGGWLRWGLGRRNGVHSLEQSDASGREPADLIPVPFSSPPEGTRPAALRSRSRKNRGLAPGS
jgi:hypothetical protein